MNTPRSLSYPSLETNPAHPGLYTSTVEHASRRRISRAKMKETAQAAEEKARAAGEAAASGLSKGPLLAFVGLLLGAGAASLGGRSGTPRLLLEENMTTR
ncbi:MAG: hypothetical protein H0X40_17290 [Chthoniobacterales bacterium]|nr:hypothetical protein [Chthoniobacterales bacterium]